MEKAKAPIVNFFFLLQLNVYLASGDEYREGYLSMCDFSQVVSSRGKPHDKLSSYKEIRANIISLAIKIE